MTINYIILLKREKIKIIMSKRLSKNMEFKKAKFSMYL